MYCNTKCIIYHFKYKLVQELDSDLGRECPICFEEFLKGNINIYLYLFLNNNLLQ